MDLRNAVVQSKPREQAGATTAGRFDYQKDWALCRLMELHKSSADYLIAFEFFDDVAVLNSENAPDRISFFQIKTRKTSPMSLADLLRRKQGEGKRLLSIFGKLYYNKIAFPDHIQSLTVISNVVFKVDLLDNAVKSTDQQCVCCNELNISVQARIARQLKEEHGLAKDVVLGDMIFLEVSDLPLSGHDTHTKGKLADFLERINPSGKFRIPLIYRTIADEIKRKNNDHSDLTAFDQFVRHKTIGRAAFADILRRIGAYEDLDSVWQRIEGRLNTEQIAVASVQRLHHEFRRFEIDRLSPTNTGLRHLEAAVKAFTAEAQAATPELTLKEFLDGVVSGIRGKPNAAEYARYDHDYVRAVGLVLLYEG